MVSAEERGEEWLDNDRDAVTPLFNESDEAVAMEPGTSKALGSTL